MNRKFHTLLSIIFIFFAALLHANDYRVAVEISLHQAEIVNQLKEKQRTIKDFFGTIAKPKNPLNQEYKQKLNSILNTLASNGLGKKGWGTLNRTGNPFHITLAYIDDRLTQDDLISFKQVLERAAKKIVIQFPNGLGDFSIQGSPSFIGKKGWIAYENISDPSGNLKKMAQILSEELKTNTPHSINKDHPIFKAHVSIGMVGNNSYLDNQKRIFLKENPFYLQLLANDKTSPHNSLLSGIQNILETKGSFNHEIKFNITNFTLKIADLRNADNIVHSEIIYGLPSGLSAQLIILTSKLDVLKSKLLLLKDQLQRLKTKLTQ